MKTFVLVAGATLALLIPATAAAKGPSEAKITGPGLGAAVTISGVGEGSTSTDLGLLVSETGFFPEVFGELPTPLLRTRPRQLGPRYTVTYTVPGPSTDTLEQELYPYAADGPASYMRPGQKFWSAQSTVGGWYRGTAQLKAMLIKAGLPKSAATLRARAAISGSKTIAISTGLGIALGAGGLALLRRRS